MEAADGRRQREVWTGAQLRRLLAATGRSWTSTTSRRSLAVLPKGRKRRLTVLRQFFALARRQRMILLEATTGLTAKQPAGFLGRTVLLEQQRQLFRRWTTGPDVHPHEALLGILGLIHELSSLEVRSLQVTDIDHTDHTTRVAGRPHPVPLDPANWEVVQWVRASGMKQR